jgi:putative spermidine/putrescine transport system ATP-binding protein
MHEPLSNLDAKLRLEMRAEIRRIHDLIGSATIYVTHDQEEALSLADRIVVMRSGEVRQVGAPEDLYERPAHADVAEFMGYRNQLRVGAARAGNKVAISAGAIRLEGTAVEPFADGNAIAAIRPDDLLVTADGAVEAKTESSQYHGDYFYSSGRTDPAHVLVYSGARP